MAVTTAGPVQDAQLVGSWFAVELDNGVEGRFTDVSGLANSVEVVEFHESSADTSSRKRPGSTKYGELTLKRGMTADKSFWDWAKKVRDGDLMFRTNGAVVVYDMTSSTEMGRWTFTNAWISKWSASDLDVGSDDITMEEITLQIEQLERVK